MKFTRPLMKPMCDHCRVIRRQGVVMVVHRSDKPCTR